MDTTTQSQITVFEGKDSSGRTEDSKDHISHVWTVPEVEALLKLYREREVEFKDPTTKKKAIWNDICVEMNHQGYAVNPMQCECKLKNMKATYRKSLEKAERGIDPAARCPFYEELYDIFGLAPPLRTYPESTKSRKPFLGKRSAEDGEQVSSPASQITQIGLAQLQHQQNGLNENVVEGVANKRSALMLEVLDGQNHHETERRNYAELVEELLVLRRSLEHERQLRDEERKKTEEERRKNEEERDRRAKEFHEERMAMLNSMNKLISNLGTKS